MSPKFTIIIPTRNRADTLFFTIKSCLEQRYDNYQIIVSDNFSEDGTENVVKSFPSTRIKYINPGKRLSMTTHWNFALEHVKGGFVTFIGDDDAFLPNVLSKISLVLSKTRTKAITWRKAEYCWPNHIYAPYRNYLSIPFSNAHIIKNSNKEFLKALNFEIGYNSLPCIYNSFVDISFLKPNERSRVFFDTIYPDIYSGFSIALHLDNYIFSNEPYSVNGASKHSNGTSAFFRDLKSKPYDEFFKENYLDSGLSKFFKNQQGLVMGATFEVILALKKNYPDKTNFFSINYKYFLVKIAEEYKIFNLSNPFIQESIMELEEIAKEYNCLAEIKKVLKSLPPSKKNPVIKYGVRLNSLNINAKFFKIKNAYEAAKLVRIATFIFSFLNLVFYIPRKALEILLYFPSIRFLYKKLRNILKDFFLKIAINKS